MTPAYFTGRGYSSGSRPSKNADLDDFRFVKCTFESDGGQVYIDGGENSLTNFVFEDCIFYKASKPGLLMGRHVGPVLFQNVRIDGVAIGNAEQLRQAGFDLSVPVKFER